MKDDISNLKNITDLALKDIYVTDELRAKTLEMCKKENNKIVKPFLTAAVSAAAIALSLTGYQYLSHKSDSSLVNTKQPVQTVNNNPSIAMDNTGTSPNSVQGPVGTQKLKESLTNDYTDTKSKVSLDKTPNTHESKNSVQKDITNNNIVPKDTNTNVASTNDNKASSENVILDKQIPEDVRNNIASDNVVLQDVPNVKLSKPASDSTTANSFIAAVTGTLTTAEAEKYWGGSITLPSYIPSGFELTDISIAKDDKEKYVKLTYSLNNTYFKITQNKSTKYNITGKKLNINNTTVTISENKIDSNTNESVTEIVFEKDNIQYLIVGNISEPELTNIVKSLIQ